MPGNPFDLERFVEAQASSFERALAELGRGRKRTHWMWFIFPQLRGLGSSSNAIRFGITSLEEARAYLAHPVLGARLRDCTDAVLHVEGATLNAIFGSPDDVKFRSSMTLFECAGGDADPRFGAALDRYCGGERDLQTVTLLHAD